VISTNSPAGSVYEQLTTFALLPTTPGAERRMNWPRAEQTMRVRIARDELRHIRELSHTIKALEAEIAQLVAQIAPQLLSEPGFGPLTAAKLAGEIAGAGRFASDAKWSSPRFRGHLIAGPSGPAARISVHACAVSVGVPP
jgi:transposase